MYELFFYMSNINRVLCTRDDSWSQDDKKGEVFHSRVKTYTNSIEKEKDLKCTGKYYSVL